MVKPAGIPTAHAAAGGDSLYARARATRPFVGVVSRLDLPVSGVVVFAKTSAAAAALAEQFRERTVTKEYAAVVEGRFPAPLGQWVEWNYDGGLDWGLLQWDGHRGLSRAVADLNRLLREKPALHEIDFDPRGFEWIDCHDWRNSVIAFLRRSRDSGQFLLVCCNFTPVVRRDYRVGVPVAGGYREVFNGDSAWYGGGNVGNGGEIRSQPVPRHGREHSLSLTLPPLAAIVLELA